MSLLKYHKERMQHRFSIYSLHIGINLCSTMLLCILLFTSCNPTRRLQKGEYLLNKNILLKNKTKISDSELLGYVRQKTNRKILGVWRFHLWVYNTVNQETYKKNYEKRLKKRALLNEKRKAKGKKPKNQEPISLAKWRLEVGEAPVVFDTMLANRSSKQIELYLKNHGYFNAQVRDSIGMQIGRPQMRNAIFTINQGAAYTIRNIEYKFEDKSLTSLIYSDTSNCIFKIGHNYNTDELDLERSRITDFLKNKGYFAFVKNFISYKADSSVGNHHVDISIEIENPVKRISGYVDSTVSVPHTRYRINKVNVFADFSLRRDSVAHADTLFFNDVYYISEDVLNFRPRAIKSAITINHNDLYSKKEADRTYRKLADFKTFKFINIQFKPTPGDTIGLLDCEIQISPKNKQSHTEQIQGTNKAGDLGVAFDVIYQNNNLLHGLEIFEIRLNSSVEVQRIISDVDENYQAIQKFLPFNTFLFGPIVSLKLPKIPNFMKFLGSSNQQTSITTSYNYQQRPDYQRSIFTLAYGYTAHSGTRITHTLNPSEINFVTVNLSNQFGDLLDKSNNLFLKNSFQSQLISSMRYGFQYNSQRIGEMKNFFFFQGNFESSGLLIRGSREFYKSPGFDNDKYIVFGVPFSQFVRFDGDLRYYRFVGRSSSIAIRSFVGLGIPYGNSSVMPFVKSFFGGGANGIRAWIARSLGPGAYQNPTNVRFDQIGDIKLEWNFEYRAKLYKMFEGAAFIDAGNIWLRQKDIQRPLADFESNRFYKEIAVGIGAGLRLNFDFFIIRLDLAYKMRDPSFPSNDRWVIQYQKLRQGNLNFGIGYPF